MRQPEEDGYHVPVQGTRLYVVERGQGAALVILHGGPGLDHHMFGHYLDPLADRYRLLLVDQRGQGLSTPSPSETWTLAQMAQDVTDLADALDLPHYTVLGHSYGAFVALQHAVDFPGAAAATIVSSGIPSARYLSHVEASLASFAPAELREQLVISWARERVARDAAEVAALLSDQLPFHFRDPLDPRIAAYEAATAGARCSAEVLRHFANLDYGGIEVEDRLATVTQPVLVLAGRYDRSCSVIAAEAIAAGVPDGRLVVFEQSGHMTFVEENERYLAEVGAFLAHVLG
jgi:pimeloyl-ACP methyl ester carboxylesterase